MDKLLSYQTQKLIPESQLRDEIKRILAEMLGVQPTKSINRQWYDTDPAYCHLGLDSSEQLRTMVRDGTLRIGVEVRDVRSPNSQIPRYQFHIEKCEARLLIPPARRKVKKIA